MTPRNLALATAAFALASTLLWSARAVAADNNAPINLVDEAPKQQSIFGFNYGPPNSPALDLLGLSSSKVASQSSLGPFLLTLPSLWDSGAGQAAAIDISPMWIYSELAPSQYYFSNYDYGYSLAARLKVDLAVTNGTSSSDASKQQPSGIAVGLSLPLLPGDDPMLVTRPGAGDRYFIECLKNEQSAVDAEFNTSREDLQKNDDTLMKLQGQLEGLVKPTDASSETAKAVLLTVLATSYGPIDGTDTDSRFASLNRNVDAAVQKAGADHDAFVANLDKTTGISSHFSACAKGASTLASAQPDLTVGLGYRENGEAGRLTKFHPGGGSAWLAWRVPLTTFGTAPEGALTKANFDAINKGKIQYLMLGGALRYDTDAELTTGNSSTPVFQANKFDAWLGLELYQSWAVLGAQYGYSTVTATQSIDSKFDQKGSRWLTSAAVKLGSSPLWLGATYGNANGNTAKLDDRTFLLTVYFSPPNADALFGNKLGSSGSGQGGAQ